MFLPKSCFVGKNRLYGKGLSLPILGGFEGETFRLPYMRILLLRADPLLRARQSQDPVAKGMPLGQLVMAASIVDVDQIFIIQRYGAHLVIGRRKHLDHIMPDRPPSRPTAPSRPHPVDRGKSHRAQKLSRGSCAWWTWNWPPCLPYRYQIPSTSTEGQ